MKTRIENRKRGEAIFRRVESKNTKMQNPRPKTQIARDHAQRARRNTREAILDANEKHEHTRKNMRAVVLETNRKKTPACASYILRSKTAKRTRDYFRRVESRNACTKTENVRAAILGTYILKMHFFQFRLHGPLLL